jgi:hypothetical protein
VRSIRNFLAYSSLPLLRKKRARRRVYSFFKPVVRLSLTFLRAQSLRVIAARGLVSRALAVFYTRQRNPYFKAVRRSAGASLVLSRFYHKLERRRLRASYSFTRIRNFIKKSFRGLYKAGSFRKRGIKLRSLI